MDYKSLGKRIRKARRFADLTQEQLAEAAGVSTSFIGHIERGTRVPSVQTLFAICRALGCSLDYVVNNAFLTQPTR